MSGPDDVEVSDLVFREVLKDEDKDKPDSKDKIDKIIADYEKSLGEAKYVTVEKVVRTTTEDTEGNYSTTFFKILRSSIYNEIPLKKRSSNKL